jgi:hypothetical protein
VCSKHQELNATLTLYKEQVPTLQNGSLIQHGKRVDVDLFIAVAINILILHNS